MKKKIIIFVLSILMLLPLVGCQANKVEEVIQEEKITQTVGIKEINKHGNVILAVYADDLKNSFAPGDIVDVEVNSNTLTLPVGTSYSDVNQGECILRYDLEDNGAVLAINMGNFAKLVGIEDTTPTINITMNQAQGYLTQYSARNLKRSNVREDYPNLSDEEFANFRVVKMGDIKEGILYRSSSPIDPDLGRNIYADNLSKQYGVVSMINIADEADEMAEYEGYAESYYAKCNIVNISMGYDFTSKENLENIAAVVRFVINNEGPYLIHCKEGKDRSGMVNALIEALMGAKLDEIVNDYMLSYVYFYSVTDADEIYKNVKDDIFLKSFAQMLNVEDINEADLSKSANAYLLNAGLSNSEIEAFKNKLSK